jgi:outer membrane biosynthesis protein TonB
VKIKVDKTVMASVALHVLVLGWVMLSFSTKALEIQLEEVVPVEVSLSDQPAKAMAGLKTGKKENPKPLVDKIAEAKPVEETVGKITEKAPVVTETAAPPQPKVEEKPVEKKPDPPKVVEKPKVEEKPVEKKPDPKVDQIGDTIKKEEKKPPPKPPVQAAKPPPPEPPKQRIVERHFDQNQIAALLDKRDPTRQATAGDTLNSNAALGTAKGSAASNSANWQSAFMQRVRQCFNFPYNGVDVDAYFADIDIPMKPDGTLGGQPVVQRTYGPASGVAKAMADNAVRAIVQCAPYTSLPKEQYASWKLIETRFGLKEFR